MKITLQFGHRAFRSFVQFVCRVTISHTQKKQVQLLLLLLKHKTRQENELLYKTTIFVEIIVCVHMFSVHIGMNEFLLRKFVISKNFYSTTTRYELQHTIFFFFFFLFIIIIIHIIV